MSYNTSAVAQRCRLSAQYAVNPNERESAAIDVPRIVRYNLSQMLAETILNSDPDPVVVSYPDALREVHRVDLYVFTPAQFQLAVREEAKKYLALAQRYPLYEMTRL